MTTERDMGGATERQAPDFKPSQVHLGHPPLTATMRHSESEHAAACLVRVCQAHGDTWAPQTWAAMRDVIREDCEAKREPLASLMRNPFFRPEVGRLIADGFATLTKDALAFRTSSPARNCNSNEGHR